MKLRKLPQLRVLIVVLLLTGLPFALTSCGDSGTEETEPFAPGSGSWSGQMRQLGGANCSDGSFIGAGTGTDTRMLTFLIIGGDAVGAIASMNLDGCEYTGFRESGVTLIFRSDESFCNQEIIFDDIEFDSANVTLIPRTPDTEDGNGIVCVISEGGAVHRNA